MTDGDVPDGDGSNGGTQSGDRDVRAVERRIRDRHAGTVVAVVEAADAVAAGWDEEFSTDSRSVARALDAELDRRDLGNPLVELLVDGLGATDHESPAEPVPAPPYLAVTARGPVLRATVDDGRFVITLQVFRIRGDERRYVRTGSSPDEVVSVAFRPDPRTRD